jgi:hypothetical protein
LPLLVEVIQALKGRLQKSQDQASNGFKANNGWARNRSWYASFSKSDSWRDLPVVLERGASSRPKKESPFSIVISGIVYIEQEI